MKTLYFSSTILLSVFLAWSAYSYLFSKNTIEGIRALGFPDHFRVQLAVLKLIAILVLLIPQVPLPAKDWAYAGVAMFFLTAIVAHTAHGDPLIITLINLVLIGVLVTSRVSLAQC